MLLLSIHDLDPCLWRPFSESRAISTNSRDTREPTSDFFLKKKKEKKEPLNFTNNLCTIDRQNFEISK